MNKPLAEIFRYNKWATLELVRACRDLNQDQLDTHVKGVSGSVRELLIHLVGAQQTFVLRTKGRQHEGELARGSEWPGFEDLLKIAEESSDQLISIAEELDVDSEVGLPWFGEVYRYPKSFFLVHAAEHGVEHRTEIKVALGHIGVETPDLDGWSYADAAINQDV